MSKEFDQYQKDVNGDRPFQQFYEKEEDFQKKLEEIIKKTLRAGQLLTVGSKQTGKTTANMWLLKTLMEMHKTNEVKTIIFDTVLNFRYNFNAVPYIDHSKLRYLPIVRDLIIDLPYTDIQRTRNAIGEILKEDFVKKHQLKKKFGGRVPFTSLFLLEEIQNIFGTYSLNGKAGHFFLKVFSECMNYRIAIWGITQRCSDVSTKVLERSEAYLIGKLTGDNDLKKISRVTTKQVAEKVKSLTRGEFIFWDRDQSETIDLVYFPKFHQTSKPYPYEDAERKNGNGYIKRIFLGS